MLPERLKLASRPAAIHLSFSVLVGVVLAILVFNVWYQDGLYGITGGASLFLILMAVDVVCGPLLTWILYSPSKAAWKWRVDISLILTIQLAALLYGLHQVAGARPVILGFEGDRIRVVQAFDIDATALALAPKELRRLSWTGPHLIMVRLAQSTDPDFLASIQLALQGRHPSFRPDRWLGQRDLIQTLDSAIVPLSALPNSAGSTPRHQIDEVLRLNGLSDDQAGYLPLVRGAVTDWIVVLRRGSSEPLAYLHIDGWND